ncbi:hypothetical protein C0J09_07695 [Bordetella avium]|nr:hypothetical protein C0J09_07695 [Bordetella avium]
MEGVADDRRSYREVRKNGKQTAAYRTVVHFSLELGPLTETVACLLISQERLIAMSNRLFASLIACTSFTLMAPFAQAQSGDFYVGARVAGEFERLKDVKGHFGDDDVKLGSSDRENHLLGALALGYYLTPEWRVEAELGLSGSQTYRFKRQMMGEALDLKTHVSSQRLMFNVYRDIPLGDKFSLYGSVGLGLTASRMKADFTQTSADEEPQHGSFGRRSQTLFTASLGVGASYALTKDMSVDLGYRYIRMATAKTGALAEEGAEPGAHLHARPEAHEVSLGVRYRF